MRDVFSYKPPSQSSIFRELALDRPSGIASVAKASECGYDWVRHGTWAEQLLTMKSVSPDVVAYFRIVFLFALVNGEGKSNQCPGRGLCDKVAAQGDTECSTA
jgi:hypothetical protein